MLVAPASLIKQAQKMSKPGLTDFEWRQYLFLLGISGMLACVEHMLAF